MSSSEGEEPENDNHQDRDREPEGPELGEVDNREEIELAAANVGPGEDDFPIEYLSRRLDERNEVSYSYFYNGSDSDKESVEGSQKDYVDKDEEKCNKYYGLLATEDNGEQRKILVENLVKLEDKCEGQDESLNWLVKKLGSTLRENDRLNRLLLEIDKAKGKRSAGNTRIEEDGSKNVVQVLEGQRPLRIFPEEIWLMIFNLVEDPQDLENCFRTCQEFRRMLEPNRSSFLLPKVFKLVDSKYPLSIPDILTCRLVSSSWKKVADLNLQTKDYRYNFRYVNESVYNRSEKFVYTFKDPSAIRPFKNGMDGLHKMGLQLYSEVYTFNKESWSPFPSGHLILSEEDIPHLPPEDHFIPRRLAIQSYQSSTTLLLERVKDHLYFLDVWVRFFRHSENWYKTLFEWLSHTPNLKVLQFSYPYCDSEYKEDRMVLDTAVRFRTFPHLKNLVMLTLQNTPKEVIQAALEANKHIKKLQILRTSLDVHLDKDLFNGLANLQQFSVSITSTKEFEIFEQFTWKKLETLYLNLEDCPGDLHWGRIFRCVEHFRETLTHLILKLPAFFPNLWKEEELRLEPEVGLLSLPNLKKLKISMENLNPVDFLFGLTALEDLYFIVDHTSYQYDKQLRENREIIKFNGFYDCLETSNIWDAVPSLKKVYLAVKDYNFGCLIYRRHLYKKMESGEVVKMDC